MNKGRIRAVIINLVLLALVAGAGWWGWSALHPAAVVDTTLATTTVSLGNVTSTVSASGKVVSPGDVAISATINNATIISLYVAVGAHVAQGQVLAQLDSNTQKAAFDQATGSLANAKNAFTKLTKKRTADEQTQADIQLGQSKASADTAQRNLDEQTALILANVATYQASVDAAKKTLDDATANATDNVATYQASVDAAKKTLDDATANATDNVATYQASVDAAKKSFDDATANAAESAVTYQNSVDSSKTILDAAQATFDNYSRIFSGLTLEFCNSLFVTSANCTTYLGNYNSLQSAKTSYSNAVQTQKVNLKKDTQNLAGLQVAYQNSKSIQTANLKKDAQNLAGLQVAYQNSKSTQTANLKKDAQNLAGLQVAYQNSKSTQTLNLKKDAVSLQSYKNSVASAKTSYDLLVTQQAIAIAPPLQADLDTAQNAIKNAQATYDAAERTLAATTIKAPVEADVASISATVGQTAPTGTAKTNGVVTGFIVLTNVSALRIEASFSEADASKIITGEAATFAFEALPTTVAAGRVSRVDILPTIANNVVSYSVVMDITGGVPSLKPGMTTTATITTGSATNVLRVSAQAVTTRGQSSTVRTVKSIKGKQVVTSVPVVVGLKGDSDIEIQSGLKDGDVVALNAAARSTITNGFSRSGVPAGLGGGGVGGGGVGGGGRGGGG